MQKKLAKLIILLSGALILASCSSRTYRNINYLQDVTSDSTWKMTANAGVVIQPKDQLSIVVSSKDPELAASFNLPVASYQAGSEITATSYGNQRLLGYVVDNDGDIDFPILGTIHVAGLNRWQLSRLIKEELEDRELLKGAVVTVEFMNFRISVLGHHPASAQPCQRPHDLWQARQHNRHQGAERQARVVQDRPPLQEPFRLAGILPSAKRRGLRRAEQGPRPPVHPERKQRQVGRLLDVDRLVPDFGRQSHHHFDQINKIA